jgi:hypothetical protein
MKDTEEHKPTDYSGIIIFVITLPVLFFFRHIGKNDMGLTVGICLGINLLVIRLYWKRLGKRAWFWCVIVLILALHLPLIFKVQWPHEWVPGIALLPMGLADLFIYVGVIWLIQKFITKDAPYDEEV